MAAEKKPTVIDKLLQPAKAWLTRNDKVGEIKEYDVGYDSVNVSMLLGSGKRGARNRQQLYEKYHFMAGDPLISTALRLHVTQALGGHETTGDTVFIEKKPETEKQPQASKIVDEINTALSPLFNRIAHQSAFNGTAFGDSYARIYSKEKVGVVDAYVDEMIYPPLVQAYEQGNRTVGYVISIGQKFAERLSVKQMSRLKMPRMLYVAQTKALEKSVRMAITEDDIDNLPILPAMVGGSFLDAAEESFDNLIAALMGLVGQRLAASNEEIIVAANYTDMTVAERKQFGDSLKGMFLASKERAEKAVKDGVPLCGRHYHLIPKFNEKQALEMSPVVGPNGNGNITIEDVMLHAKLLAGALGLDLSMLGFSELLSGGLGDGGFFRVSAQSAERSRMIRTGLTQFFHDIVDLHTMSKYGWAYEEGDRPYNINFYGSISALETEKQHTAEAAMNTGTALVQTLTQMRDLGMPEEANQQILSTVLKLDEALAKQLSSGLKNAKPPPDPNGGGGFGGGGFGGAPDGAQGEE